MPSPKAWNFIWKTLALFALKNLSCSFLRNINTLLLTGRTERTHAQSWEAGYGFQRTAWNTLSLKHTEAYLIKKPTDNKC